MTFAKYILKQKVCRQVKILVVDYCGKVCEPDCRSIKIVHMHSLDQLKDKEIFHVVIASAVIEHLLNPGRDMKKLFSVMKTGAVIYFRTPYVYPIYRGFKRIGIQYDTFFPDHIWDFGGDGWWRNLAEYIHIDQDCINIVASRPSIVEKTFKDHFGIALASYALKAPWYVFRRWPFVGGWETVFEKKSSMQQC